MSREYNVIDADGHVLEAPDLWLNYIESKFRDRAPRLGTTSDGAEVLQLGEQEITDNGPGRRRVKVGATGAIGAREGKVSVLIKYAEGRAGGFDPHARIPDMDAEGIDAAFLYPSLGLFLGAVEDSLSWRRRFAARTTAGWRITAALIRIACLAWRCCPCRTSI